MSKLGAGGGT